MPQWHSASALIRHVVHEFWRDPKELQRQGKKQTQHSVAEVDQLPKLTTAIPSDCGPRSTIHGLGVCAKILSLSALHLSLGRANLVTIRRNLRQFGVSQGFLGRACRDRCEESVKLEGGRPWRDAMQAAKGGRDLVRLLKVRQLFTLSKQSSQLFRPRQLEGKTSPFVSPWLPSAFYRHVGGAASPGLDHTFPNFQEKVDPFSLVADELNVVAVRLREMVTAEVPVLALAAEYFFKLGVEGKRFRPMVLLLLSTSLMTTPVHGLVEIVFDKRRLQQQQLAEITEMIHVASLLHDDVLDHADTRRGITSLNTAMGNKLAVLAGDFLLARASVALASLQNTEVVQLLSQVLEHLVTGEIMQLSSDAKDVSSMEYYMQKTFYKTASLMANSCKSIAVLAGQPQEVALLAFDYGRHLGLAYQLVDDALDFTGTQKTLGKPALSDLGQGIVTAPVLFALKEFPEMTKLIEKKFKKGADLQRAVEMVKESRGIAKTHELAAEHAQKAVESITRLPPNPSLIVQQCRRALIDLAHQVITRSK